MKSHLQVFCAMVCLISCQSHSAIEMSFDSILTVGNDIPTVRPYGKEEIPLDGIGQTDIIIKDNLLFVTTINDDGYVQIYSIQEMTCLGKCILQGNGLMECAFGVNTSMMSFLKKFVTPLLFQGLERLCAGLGHPTIH